MSTDPIQKVPQVPSLRFLYTSSIGIAKPIIAGHSPYGERRIIPITGGAFAGPRLSGRVVPGGADWQIIRRDGVTDLEAIYTLETDDGAIVHVRNRGFRHGPREVIERLAAGEDVDPADYYFRTTPIFETGHPDYAWLNRLIAVATGQRRATEVVITVYEVT